MASSSPFSRFRKERMKLFQSMVNNYNTKGTLVHILDVGGSVSYWKNYTNDFSVPVKIDIMNISLENDCDIDYDLFSLIIGDACNMSMIEDNKYDFVHSNSVIEHVGRWENMEAIAREIRRVGKHYFVQTPNFWFPVEPHARTPFLHWIPEQVRYRIAMRRKLGFWSKCDTVDKAMRTVQSSSLLDQYMMRHLFPDASITFENFLLMKKSIIAVR